MVLRPVNLLMVAFSQLLIFFLLLYPIFDEYNIGYSLSPTNALLFILTSVIVTGAGNLINDICDLKADIVNKPERVYIGEMAMSTTTAHIYYIVLLLTGAILSAKIAWDINRPWLWLIYPAITLILFSYSATLKRLPLLGNLVIAVFATLVPGMVLFAEYGSIQQLEEVNFMAYEFVFFISLAYLSFSVFSTWYRELIKDLEDIEGDLMQSYLTYPVMSGPRESQDFAISLGYTLLITFSFWLYILNFFSYGLLYYLLFFILLPLPLIFIIRMTYHANEKRDYTKISKNLKLLMINSLVFFIMLILGF